MNRHGCDRNKLSTLLGYSLCVCVMSCYSSEHTVCAEYMVCVVLTAT